MVLPLPTIAGMHEVRPARENIGLQRDAELPAIVDDVHVMVRDAAGPGIEPEPLVEFAGLQRRRAADFPKTVAAAQREAAPADAAARFQHDAIEAGAIELIGGAQAGDAGAEDGDRLAGAGVLGQAEARGHRRRSFEEIEHRQGLVGGAGAAQARHGAQKSATGHRHGICSVGWCC